MKIRDRGGFTLIELLVVIFIIGILTAILIPAIRKAYRAAHANETAPQLRGPVNDDAKLLTDAQIETVSQNLLAIQEKTGNQIVVLIVPQLDGKEIGKFALETAISWKLGQKDKDNGVLFVIAVEEHKTWITVGRGLEGDLTDASCRRILAHVVKPKFKAGDYFAGIVGAVNAINVQIGGGGVAAIPEPPAETSFWTTWLGIVIIIIVILIIIVVLLKSGGVDGDGAVIGSILGSLGSGSSDSGTSSYGGGGGDFGGGGAGGDW
jgi:uncharacterized protein